MKKRLIYFMICLLGSGITAQAQYTYTLKQCLEEGLANNYSLRITRNEEQISKNNATLGNAGYLPTVDLTAGYTGNADNSNTKARATGETTKLRGVYDQTLDAGVDLNWTIFDGFNISTTYKQLKELERQGATNTRAAEGSSYEYIRDYTEEINTLVDSIVPDAAFVSARVSSGSGNIHIEISHTLSAQSVL
jgi:outer membrane protein, adhesin transport system